MCLPTSWIRTTRSPTTLTLRRAPLLLVLLPLIFFILLKFVFFFPPDRNLERRAVDLSNELKRRAEWFATENLLVPGGDDFRWQNAAVQYNNWDKLVVFFFFLSSVQLY